MYKIFIDTNWFFDFYRTKAKDKIVEMKPIFKKYKKYFVNTEQSRDEFYRNRVRIISEFEENLKKQINSINDNSFLYDLVEYEDYKNNIIDANNKINKILNVIYVPVFLHKFLKTLAQTLGSSTMNNERYSKKMTLDS